MRGRRPGQPDTRQAIAEIARRRFLAAGYPEVSLRSVADEAGVDVALLSYYFGSKRGLFVEALAAVEEPGRRLTAAMAGGDLSTLARRLLEETLRAWDEERGGTLKAVASSAPHEPEIRDLYARAVERTWIDQLAGRLDGPDARARAAAFTIIVTGVVYSRYLLCVEPIASMPAAELVDLLAPALTVALLGPGGGDRGSSDGV